MLFMCVWACVGGGGVQVDSSKLKERIIVSATPLLAAMTLKVSHCSVYVCLGEPLSVFVCVCMCGESVCICARPLIAMMTFWCEVL